MPGAKLDRGLLQAGRAAGFAHASGCRAEHEAKVKCVFRAGQYPWCHPCLPFLHVCTSSPGVKLKRFDKSWMTCGMCTCCAMHTAKLQYVSMAVQGASHLHWQHFLSPGSHVCWNASSRETWEAAVGCNLQGAPVLCMQPHLSSRPRYMSLSHFWSHPGAFILLPRKPIAELESLVCL